MFYLDEQLWELEEMKMTEKWELKLASFPAQKLPAEIWDKNWFVLIISVDPIIISTPRRCARFRNEDTSA